jgi:hypothetical protein
MGGLKAGNLHFLATHRSHCRFFCCCILHILLINDQAYFTYVPLNIGLPIIGGLFVLYQIRSSVKAQQAQKLTHMDERTMESLVNELSGAADADASNASKRAEVEKAKKKVAARLVQEKKVEAKKAGKKKKPNQQEEEDLDDDALLTFVKPSSKAKKS